MKIHLVYNKDHDDSFLILRKPKFENFKALGYNANVPLRCRKKNILVFEF